MLKLGMLTLQQCISLESKKFWRFKEKLYTIPFTATLIARGWYKKLSNGIMMMHGLFFALALLSLPFVATATYPTYEDCPVNRSAFRYFPESCGPGAYLNPAVTKYIDIEQISSILEVGSRDGLDAIALSEYYQCHVFAFECNPLCLKICQHNAALTKNVTIVDKAAWDKEGVIPFFPIIPGAGKITDPGSSSCFHLTEKKRASYDQEQITVSAVRLDQWLKENDIESVDLICMDTQGATLKILQGMGDALKQTKYIVTECEVECIYEGECLLPELVFYLQGYGFERIPTAMEYDYLFVNRNLIPKKKK